MTKNRLKSLIYGFELRSTACIANGLVHKTPKRVILAQIKSDLLVTQSRIHLNSAETNRLWLESVSRYTNISKKTFSSLKRSDLDYKEKLLERQNAVYTHIRASVLPRLEHQKNEMANDVEDRIKRDSLRELFRDEGKEKGKGTVERNIFYLCSSHLHPAKDHVDYEGKIYVDKDWEAKLNSSLQDNPDGQDMHGKIAAYIRNHRILTVQEVTYSEPYLVLRPNCKHYFIPVSVSEVLGSSAKSLLRRHKMYMPDEIPMSYETSQYKAYYERLKALQYLREMCPSEKLELDIKNTRKLVQKWYRASKQMTKTK